MVVLRRAEVFFSDYIVTHNTLWGGGSFEWVRENSQMFPLLPYFYPLKTIPPPKLSPPPQTIASLTPFHILRLK